VLIRHRRLGGGWGRGVAAALAILLSPLALCASTLFLKPLHLVRRVDDPISKTTATIDEYCLGNRVVTIHGSKVVIADYEAQELTEIDHAAQTWSVTPFADIAKSRTDLDARMSNGAAPHSARLTALGRRTSGAVDAFVADDTHRRLEIGFNRSVTLSRAAAEVLIGAAYPNTRGEESDAILDAAANRSSLSALSAGTPSEPSYGLLVERTLTIVDGASTLVSHNTVVRVGDEMPPAEAMLIDPGAKRIESRLTRLARELRAVDSLPSAH